MELPTSIAEFAKKIDLRVYFFWMYTVAVREVL